MSGARNAWVCLLVAASLSAAGKDAAKLFKQGQKQERAGHVVRAYLLYAEAAALEPANPRYWGRSLALRTRAIEKAKPSPPPAAGGGDQVAAPAPGSSRERAFGEFSTTLTEEDLADLRRLKPPPELRASPECKTLDLRGDAKAVFAQAGREFKLEVVFDADFQPGASVHVHTDQADYRETLRALEKATDSFVIPVSERVFMVAKEGPQKRAQLEPTVAISVPIPAAASVQDAQELARNVQQTMEILKFGVDAQRQMVFLRDRISKVRPALALFEQLSQHRAQVEVELEFLEVDRNAMLSYGLLKPTQFPIAYLGSVLHSKPSITSATRLLTFGGGKSLLGFGVAEAELLATMTGSSAKSLFRAELRALDGQPASLHVGDKYPIRTGGFLASGLAGFASFNFEDLGLSVKLTPHVHGAEEVSLDLEAEFKVLAGQSVNGIPVISNRKITSKVRLRNGDWGVVAGLLNSNEARSVSGMWGLVSLPVLGPLFSQHQTTRDTSEVLILLKPKLLSAPPSETPARALYLGSESRLQIPL